MNLRRWLAPGIGIKRWLAVVFLGLLFLALALAHLLRQASRDLEPGGAVGALIDLTTLQFLPYPFRGLIVGCLGATLVVVGEHDAISTAAEMRKIADAIPGARYVEIKGAGHMSPLEMPEPVNAALDSFLQSLV